MPDATKEQLIDLIVRSDIDPRSMQKLFNEVIKILLQGVSKEIIRQVRETFNDRSPKALVCIARVTREKCDLERAGMAVISEYQRESLKGREYRADDTFDMFISLAINMENFNEARKFVRIVKEQYFVIAKCLEIAKISHDVQDLEYATSIVVQSNDYGYINNTLPEIVDVAIQIGDIEEARKITLKISDGEIQTVNFLKIFQASHNENDIDSAREAASKEIQYPVWFGSNQSIAFLKIFEVSHNQRDIDSAREKAKNWQLFFKIAKLSKKECDFEKVITEIIELEQDDYRKNRELRDLAWEFAKLGRLEQARRIAREINEHDDQSGAFVGIARYSHEAQDFEQALKATNMPRVIDWVKNECLLNIISEIGEIETMGK